MQQSHDVAASFPLACRHWRLQRKYSQLELALLANISQRHISWLETGRSQPSRDMVIRLSEALEIPLRERNVLLQCAGYAAIYRESALDEPAMTPVHDALRHVLEHHAPLPAVVVDRLWNVQMFNHAAGALLQLAGIPRESASSQENTINLIELSLHPQRLRPYISNWEQAAPALLRRLQIEAIAAGEGPLREQLTALMQLAPEIDPMQPVDGGLLPVLPLELRIDGLELSLFSVISTFGTPQDVTTDELRIEAFYPTDAATQAFFEQSQPVQ